VVLAPFRSAAAAIILLATGAFIICTGSACTPQAWELRMLEWFSAQRSPLLDALFATVTWLGSLWLLLPLGLVLVASQVAAGHGARAVRFAAAFGGAVALGYVVKSLVARARPSGLEPLVAMPGDFSFPSGHAMQITAFTLAAILTLAPPTQRGRWFAVALIAIVLVGASRLYLQVHFLSDVLAGIAAAAVWVLGYAPENRGRHA
jgi:membrane-associated phospholipid phosphatase